MHAILFYISFPFIYLIALLPFRLLYVVSDIFYFIMLLTGYRKGVILTNLRNSFPEKSEKRFRLCSKYITITCVI